MLFTSNVHTFLGTTCPGCFMKTEKNYMSVSKEENSSISGTAFCSHSCYLKVKQMNESNTHGEGKATVQSVLESLDFSRWLCL